jgi:hypothetical protein
MPDLIVYFPMLVLVGATVGGWTVLYMLGLPFMPWWNRTPERAAPWRRLRLWQVVVTRFLCIFPVPLLLLIASWDYQDIVTQRDTQRLVPSYIPQHDYLTTAIVVIICIVGGILDARSFWKRIWEAKYDVPGGDLNPHPNAHFSRP